MALLEIDLGNSRAKWRFSALGLSGSLPSEWFAGGEPQPPQWQGLGVETIWLASVRTELATQTAIASLQRYFTCDIHLAYSSPAAGGVINGYAEPDRLGVDRWLALMAARKCVSGDCVVVDAGTAITLDLLRHDGHHLGGYILPGVARLVQSLSLGTGRVQVEGLALQPHFAPGQNTQDCVAVAVTAAIAGLCTHASRLLPNAHWCLTGGDVSWLAAVCREQHLVHTLYPDLVLDGLAWAARKVFSPL